MADPFYAEIRIFSFPFAPYAWAFCDGAQQIIQQNPAVYSLIGTTFGGDGRTTYNLPNLQGSAVIGTGQGPGLHPYQLGNVGGSYQTTMLQSQLPLHTHAFNISLPFTPAVTPTPAVTTLPAVENTDLLTYAPYPGNTTFAATSIGPAGGGLPHENRQPFLALSFCIAMEGEYPTFP